MGSRLTVIAAPGELVYPLGICALLSFQQMATLNTIFIAIAIEDQRWHDLLTGQLSLPECPFEYIDMSVKEPYDSGWKDKVRARIRRSHGVIALVSKSLLPAAGQQWEISCAKEEWKPIRGIWAYSDDRTNLAGVSTVARTWDSIKSFIQGL